ncbi:MAG: hypothetical protein KGZ38_05010 [Erysipelothrix sp.]|nr:hypothetical protein [Erysipelothrix sp.]
MSNECRLCKKKFSRRKVYCTYCLKKEVSLLIQMSEATTDNQDLQYIADILYEKKHYLESLNVLDKISEPTGELYFALAQNLIYYDIDNNIERISEYLDKAEVMGEPVSIQLMGVVYAYKVAKQAREANVTQVEVDKAILFLEQADVNSDIINGTLGLLYYIKAEILRESSSYDGMKLIDYLQEAYYAYGYEAAKDMLALVYNEQGINLGRKDSPEYKKVAEDFFIQAGALGNNDAKLNLELLRKGVKERYYDGVIHHFPSM